jgi:hypothetical protein
MHILVSRLIEWVSHTVFSTPTTSSFDTFSAEIIILIICENSELFDLHLYVSQMDTLSSFIKEEQLLHQQQQHSDMLPLYG